MRRYLCLAAAVQALAPPKINLGDYLVQRAVQQQLNYMADLKNEPCDACVPRITPSPRCVYSTQAGELAQGLPGPRPPRQQFAAALPGHIRCRVRPTQQAVSGVSGGPRHRREGDSTNRGGPAAAPVGACVEIKFYGALRAPDALVDFHTGRRESSRTPSSRSKPWRFTRKSSTHSPFY